MKREIQGCWTTEKDGNYNLSLMIRNQFTEEEERGLGIGKVPAYLLLFRLDILGRSHSDTVSFHLYNLL